MELNYLSACNTLHLIRKDPDAGKAWRQEEKRTTEDGDSVTDSMDMSWCQLWGMVKNREAWHAAVHGVAKSWSQLSNWTINACWSTFLRWTYVLCIHICLFCMLSCLGLGVRMRSWSHSNLTKPHPSPPSLPLLTQQFRFRDCLSIPYHMVACLLPSPKGITIVINLNFCELAPWKGGCRALSIPFSHNSPRPATLAARSAQYA